MGKAWVIPLADETILRAELVAATIAPELADIVKWQLRYGNIEYYNWTDRKNIGSQYSWPTVSVKIVS